MKEGLGLGDRPEVMEPGLAEVLVDVARVLEISDQLVNLGQGPGVGVVDVTMDDQTDGVGLVPEQLVLHLHKGLH